MDKLAQNVTKAEDFTTLMMYENVKIGDLIFEEFKIDEQEFINAIKFYKLLDN